MPHLVTWNEQTSREFEDLRFSDLMAYGHIRIADEGDVSIYGAETVPVPAGTPVFSLYVDSYDPWVNADHFERYHGRRPTAWVAPEPDYYDEDDYGEDYDEDYSRIETLDDPDALQSKMQIPALPDRPTRCMSMEIEVGRGGSFLAEKLYAAGLAVEPYMHGYHSDVDGFVRVEEDASVGAEVIFNRMYLSRPGHAEKFERGLEILRRAVRDGQSKLDMRCGLHIHVGLNRDRSAKTAAYTQANVASLYHLWNYLEDTIFRLASANWSGHRSQHGNSYSPPTPKGTHVRDGGFGRCALNLSNYLGYLRYGGRDSGNYPTVEFRVFNTSTNQRKIRAYAALCQAMVAMAAEHTFTQESHAVFAWTESPEPDREATKERLSFILDTLPLTNAERQDILYCAERSSLASCL